jgi:16S rRNA (cytosine967-C5)-methyltransferase
VYATCSSEPEENEALALDVLRTHPGVTRVDLRQVALPSSMAPLLTDEGALRTWPHVHGLDAFYAVVLEKP